VVYRGADRGRRHGGSLARAAGTAGDRSECDDPETEAADPDPDRGGAGDRGGLLVVPWAEGHSYPSIVSAFSNGGPRDFGHLYALYFAGPIGLLAVLVGFSGATDLKVLRWLQFGCLCCSWAE
jgi:hypothetical protein